MENCRCHDEDRVCIFIFNRISINIGGLINRATKDLRHRSSVLVGFAIKKWFIRNADNLYEVYQYIKRSVASNDRDGNHSDNRSDVFAVNFSKKNENYMNRGYG